MTPVDRIAFLFESFAPDDLRRLADYYAHDATFKDPFNAVCGLPAIHRIYAHMFATLQAPRFRITRRILQGNQAVLLWEFRYGLRGRAMSIVGASHLVLAPDGRIAAHRDYWDAAEELYEKVPVLGAVMRWLKRRAMA
jgi:steroid Delta-isomerase